jgi:nitroreductase
MKPTDSSTGPEGDLQAFAGLVRSRRTHLLMDPAAEVPSDLVTALCELISWAPNHKRTWPWQVAVFTGEGRRRLGEAGAVDLTTHGIGDEAKAIKTRTKYLRAPVVLSVGSAAHRDPLFQAENRDAVAAGVQNLLLGAAATGLASFWSTAPVARGEATRELCGFSPGTEIVAVIYLGWPTGTVAAPERPAVPIRFVTH